MRRDRRLTAYEICILLLSSSEKGIKKRNNSHGEEEDEDEDSFDLKFLSKQVVVGNLFEEIFFSLGLTSTVDFFCSLKLIFFILASSFVFWYQLKY